MSSLSRIPHLGVGIGFRSELASKTFLGKDTIDVVEIVTENYYDGQKTNYEYLKKIAGYFSVIPHGVNLSIGSAEKLDFAQLKKIKDVCDAVGANYYSEHFAVTKLGDLNIGHLSPIWFTREALEMLSGKISEIQNFLKIPLVLENITSFFDVPEADLSEPEFISEICKITGCGILLDLANVHINAFNRKKDAIAYLEKMPLGNVVQIHLAGGELKNTGDGEKWFYDTHSEEINGVNADIWKLLDWVIPKTDIKAIIIERDSNFKEDFNNMFADDLARAKAAMRRVRKA